MEIVMLKCGHSGFATHANIHDGLEEHHPCCVIDNCCEVVATPNLENRMARCTYYGCDSYKSECSDCRSVCHHKNPSSIKLAFFQQHPDKEFDEFYCGCHSWD